MTIQKRDKRKRRVSKPANPPLEKSFTSPPVDTMVKSDNICKWCGRRMLDVRCQCGYVRPRNK